MSSKSARGAVVGGVMLVGVVSLLVGGCSTTSEDEIVDGQQSALDDWSSSETEVCTGEDIGGGDDDLPPLTPIEVTADAGIAVETNRVSTQNRGGASSNEAGWGVFLCTSKSNPRDMWQMKCPPNQVATCEKDLKKQRCVAGNPQQPAPPANGNGLALLGIIATGGCMAAVNPYGGAWGTVAGVADLEASAKAFCAAKRGTEIACQGHFTTLCNRLGGAHRKQCLELTFLACRACPAI